MVNMLKGSKHLWNLHESSFINFFCHSEESWLGKPLCYWYLNSYDSFLKHWLSMTSILFVIFGVCRNYIKCNYLKDLKHFVRFSVHFWNLHQIFNILKKNMTFIVYVSSKLQIVKDRLDEALNSPFQSTLRQSTCQTFQKLIKTARQDFNRIFWSLSAKRTSKRSHLVMF